ncbi:hypothetical protein [Flagellimonas sp.]|uniref:hypothetical protein n=1 Tax=Flagellimonas sp. TaxID=2058762 RepID=UPI003AB35667
MGRHKMISGVCKLCGNETELSFEHVPPATTLNRHTKYVSVEFEKYLQSKNILKDPPKGKVKQGGIGYNSFCRDCNSFLGTNYVGAYKRWVSGGLEILKNTEYAFHTYVIKEIEPLKILKQIISMFLAINKEWFLDSFPELAAFVKDSSLKDLPEKFQIHTYLTRAEKFRYMHYVVKGDITTGETIQCSEIAFPPYGYVLTINHSKQFNLLNRITKFKDFDLHKSANLRMRMSQLPTYIPFPLDYRSEEKVNSDIERANKIMEEMKEKFPILSSLEK